jgi:glycosyltransferase involved in cell wall biosynthesis
MSKLSVCIATYRGEERLKKLLPTLIHPSVYEVVLVDDGSPPETMESIRQQLRAPPGGKTLVHRFETNQGYAKCMNKAASLAKGDTLLLLDDDVQIPDFFFPILEKLFATLPNVGVLSWRSFGKNPGQSQKPVYGLLQPATQIASYCCAVKKSLWDAHNGFDTRFQFFCADSDFALRCTLAGHPSYRVWWPLVPHDEHGGSADTVNFNRHERAQNDLALFFEKWKATGVEMEVRALAMLETGAS